MSDSIRALPGRQRERDQFAAQLAAAAQGRARMLLFEGEPGIGRSALLDEIQASPLLPRRRIRVLRIDLNDGDPGDVVLRAALTLERSGWSGRLGGRRTGAFVRKLLPDWLGAIPGIGDVLEAIAATTEAVRKRRRTRPTEPRSQHARELAAVARRRPLALLLDDLHLAGDEAVEALRRLVIDAEGGVRLLVVATCRAPRLGAHRQAVHRLPERMPADRLLHHRMEPLTLDEIREWIEQRYPLTHPAQWLAGALLDEGGGVPSAMVADMHRLRDAGAILPAGHRWTVDQPKAEFVFASDIELDASDIALPEPVSAALRSATRLPPEFDALALAGLLGEDELVVEDRLAVAVRAGALVNLGVADLDNGDFSTRFRFTSSALRSRFHRSALADGIHSNSSHGARE
ncbi:MAG TPA: AAA family ATPase [Thermoanaerobaculia bacterium]|nr:AAA family ATPase [Thermoanaerobaculia bacterium]